MSIGVMIRHDPASRNYVDDVLSQARSAHDLGVRHIWFGQPFDVDAITMAAIVATAIPDMHVGTAAVSINPRHPLLVASAAQTAQAAAHGRFSLGLGLAGHAVERRAFGEVPSSVIARLRDYLAVLAAVFNQGAVDFDGAQIRAHLPKAGPLCPAVAGGAPMPIYVAAMGPRALAMAGEHADGTIPFLAGPTAIGELIKPVIDEAAAGAGRTEPRIIALVPVSVTENRESARSTARAHLAAYDRVPSYRRMLEAEGVASSAELALIGDAAEVAAGLELYRAAGATDLILYPFESDRDVLQRVWELPATL